jgi:hypothetical protein
MHPGGRDNNDCNGSGPEQRKGGPWCCQTRDLHYSTDVPTEEMAYRVDPGMSVLEGRNIQRNWATDFGDVVAGAGAKRPGRQARLHVTAVILNITE